MQNNILIFSTPEDVHFRAVDWALRSIGIEPCLVTGNHFPIDAGWGLSLSKKASSCLISGFDGSQFDLLTAKTVWYRRFHWPVISDEIAECDQTAALHEAEEFVSGIYSLASANQRWVNDPHAQAKADRKPFQLAVAKAVGMDIPDTLISNDIAQIKQFIDDQGGKVIYKTLGAMHWVSPDGHHTQFANLVKISDFEYLNSLSLVPSIFQSYIPKEYEVRVIALGEELFACKLESQSVEGGKVDWRLANNSKLGAGVTNMPEVVRKQICLYLMQMNLEYGAFDFIVNSEGRWTFLECNTSGQFLFLEEWNPSLKLLARFSEFLCRNLSLSRSQQLHLQRVSFQDFLQSQSDQERYINMAKSSRGRPKPRTWHYEN